MGAGDKRLASDLQASEPVRMHVFVDRSLIEVHLNGNAVTKVAYLDPAAQDVAIFAQGGTCIVERLEVWDMNAMWSLLGAATGPAELSQLRARDWGSRSTTSQAGLRTQIEN